MAYKTKIATGAKEKFSAAIEKGVVDGGDIVFLDNGEVVFMKDDTTPMYVTSRTQEAISVNGVTGLGIENGKEIPSGKSLDEIVKMLVQKANPATYTQPSVTLSNNGGQASGAIETGTSVVPKLKATFNKNDAGDLSKIEVLNGSTSVGESTNSPYEYTGDAIVIGDETVSFTAKVTYAEGEIKKNNLGEDSPTGHITAGTKTSSVYSIIGQRNLFYGTGIGDTPELTSNVIRNLANKKLNPIHGYSFNIPVAVGQQYIVFAYPATLRDVNQVMYVETNDTGMASSFTKTLVDVADARGGENGKKPYKVYSYAMATPAAASMTMKVTI